MSSASKADENTSIRAALLTALVTEFHRSHGKAFGTTRIATPAWGGEARIEVRRGVIESSLAVDGVTVREGSVHGRLGS